MRYTTINDMPNGTDNSLCTPQPILHFLQIHFKNHFFSNSYLGRCALDDGYLTLARGILLASQNNFTLEMEV